MLTPSYAEIILRWDPFSSEALREVMGLIRDKYALDVRVWNYRFAHQINMPVIKEMKARPEGATSDLLETVRCWMNSREQWTTEEWALVNEIYLTVRQLIDAEMRRLQ